MDFQGKHVHLYVEDDATPDQFDPLCIMQQTTQVARSKNTNTYQRRDCDPANADEAAADVTTLNSASDSITGDAYVTSKTVFERLDNWHRLDTIKNIELRFYEPNADGTKGALAFTLKGAAKYSMPTIAADYTGPVSINSTLVSNDGAFELEVAA